MSLDMPRVLAGNDLSDGPFTDWKQGRHFADRDSPTVQSAHESHLCFCHLVVGPRFTVRCAELSPGVSDVVGLRAEEQVIWPNARRIVAAVENEQPIGDRAVGELPRQSMCVEQTCPDAQCTVAPNSPPGPNPTFAGLVDLCPETVLNGAHFVGSARLAHEHHYTDVRP